MNEEDDVRAAYEKIEALLNAGRHLTVRQAMDEIGYSERHIRKALKWLADEGRATLVPGSEPHAWTRKG